MANEHAGNRRENGVPAAPPEAAPWPEEATLFRKHQAVLARHLLLLESLQERGAAQHDNSQRRAVAQMLERAREMARQAAEVTGSFVPKPGYEDPADSRTGEAGASRKRGAGDLSSPDAPPRGGKRVMMVRSKHDAVAGDGCNDDPSAKTAPDAHTIHRARARTAAEKAKNLSLSPFSVQAPHTGSQVRPPSTLNLNLNLNLKLSSRTERAGYAGFDARLRAKEARRLLQAAQHVHNRHRDHHHDPVLQEEESGDLSSATWRENAQRDGAEKNDHDDDNEKDHRERASRRKRRGADLDFDTVERARLHDNVDDEPGGQEQEEVRAAEKSKRRRRGDGLPVGS
ncbi:MAG: hypothetical protein M1832_001894 [Thelocarpon impressellum]|nr:MAG: hypothetical protein M1832_001894 [Thelocarpon impressellum]